MKKLFLLSLIFLMGTTNALAMVQLMPFASGGSTVSAAAVNYCSTQSFDRTCGSTESTVQRLVSVRGVIKNLNIAASAAPGAAKSYTYTLRKNAADTALTCQISGGSATTCTDSTNSVEVAPGDLIDVSTTPSGTPTVSYVRGEIQFDSLGNSSVSTYSYNGNGNNISNSADRFYPISGVNVSATPSSETNGQYIIPFAGTFKHLYISLGAAPGAAKSYTFTVRKNGSDTALTCQISGASATSCQDTVNSFSVAAGDLVTIKSTPAGTPTATTFVYGITYESSRPGIFLVLCSSQTSTTSASADRFIQANGVFGTMQTTALFSTVGRFFTNSEIVAMYVAVATAPDNGGGTQSYAASLYNSTDSADVVACTISEASTSCSNTTRTTVTAGKLLSYKFTPSGTPAITGIRASGAFTLIGAANVTIKNATLKNTTIAGQQ